MYVRSANKETLRVKSIAELNKLDLAGMRQRNPAAESKQIGTVTTARDIALPLYSFCGGGFSELVGYSDEGKTITVFVVSADDETQLAASRSAFEKLIKSYHFLKNRAGAPSKSDKPKDA